MGLVQAFNKLTVLGVERTDADVEARLPPDQRLPADGGGGIPYQRHVFAVVADLVAAQGRVQRARDRAEEIVGDLAFPHIVHQPADLFVELGVMVGMLRPSREPRGADDDLLMLEMRAHLVHEGVEMRNDHPLGRPACALAADGADPLHEGSVGNVDEAVAGARNGVAVRGHAPLRNRGRCPAASGRQPGARRALLRTACSSERKFSQPDATKRYRPKVISRRIKRCSPRIWGSGQR